MKKPCILLFAALIFLGGVIRLVGLGDYPSGFFRDEAALGYNAFSIWNTGKDEYGVQFPLVFRSFEVFFLPLYVYLSAPIVGLLGLSEFSTRLLSSLAGIASLFLIFFIAKEIWDKQIGLWCLFALVISPWHTFYSRGAFEGNLALTLFTAGFLFWLKFLKKEKTIHCALSILFFIASMYSYQAERLVVPLFGIIAAIFIAPLLWKKSTSFVLPIIIGLVLLLPLTLLSSKAGGYHRALGVSIFSQTITPPGWIEGEEPGLLVNNAVYLRARQLASLYLSYFSPRNLFIEGDSDKQRGVENFSVFYAWMFPFLILGLWYFLKNLDLKGKLLMSWMLLAPLPAAMTGDPFHTYRSLLLYMPLTLFIGFGLGTCWESIKKYRVVFTIALSLFALPSLVLFLFSYFILTPATRARAWDYGYGEIVDFITTLPSDTKVVVDDQWTEAYIHFLFFEKISPETYHNEVYKLGDAETYYYNDPKEIRPNRVKNYEFRIVDFPGERGDTGKVFVMTAERLPEDAFVGDPKIRLLKEIHYPAGKVAYRIVKVI